MKILYYTINGRHIASIGKVGSTAIGRAIKLKINPHFKVVSVSGNAEMERRANNGPGMWHSAPKTENPVNPIIPVRDPIERFKSACAQDDIKDINSLLDELASGARKLKTFHYRPVTDWLVDDAKVYKFPEHISEIAIDLGLDKIKQVNDSKSNNAPKPDLTKDQIKRLESIYKDDIDLYNSITTPGQIYTMPEVVEEIDINQVTYEKVSSLFSDLPRGKQILWNITITEVLRLLRSGDFEGAIEVLETTPSIYSGAVTDRNIFTSAIPN